MAKQTPLMRQYWDIKSAHTDKILLFRMGDFFELFFEDAQTAAPILGIALTQRNKKSEDQTPMCGFPHHAVAGPINKLLEHGYKVAICDQIEDPKQAKGLVKRAVTRILTPGMVYDSESLDGTQPHYLASLDKNSISFLDGSTGEAFYFKTQSAEEKLRLLRVLPIAEVVISAAEKAKLPKFHEQILISEHDQLASLDDPRLSQGAPKTAARLLSYAMSLAGEESLKALRPFEERSWLERMELSPTVIRHLEIFENNRGEKKGTLYSCINRTKTSVGARLLRQWLYFPLCDMNQINARQERVQAWVNNYQGLMELRQKLSSVNDLERSLSRIAGPNCSPRELQALSLGLDAAMEALRLDPQIQNSLLGLSKIVELSQEVQRLLVDELPMNSKQGHLIREGVNAELDELINLSTRSQQLLREMEAQEREKTQIPSLKIRYNNVFGYYIEVTNTHKSKVPSYYQRKQTLANAERYCTEELLELERKVLSAQSKRNDLELELFEELRQKVISHSGEILKCSHLVAELDLYSSLAWLSVEKRFCRPKFSNQAGITLKASRHPVVEQESGAPFVPNDIIMGPHQTMLLTGPNMAGKSTLMRQVAVIVLLAQIGSFVPAEEANLQVFDRIYTRIGASDFLAEGLSTFMVEMKETAEMLSHATDKSLVILDEVGRGTSTFDGLSLAQAILEHLLTHCRCITLFATHYHELTRLSDDFPQLSNAHMKVVEREGDIRFLYSLVQGPAMKSYGIHVARLAGLPKDLTRRAQSLLKSLENQKLSASSQLSLLDLHLDEEDSIQEEESVYKDFVDEVKGFPLDECSPIEALNQIAKWQKDLS